MSKIGTSEVKRLAALARIHLNDEQVAQLAVELDNIVTFVEQLQSADVKNVPSTDQVTGLEDVWREDEIKPSKLNRQELLKNAPMQQDGLIKVRRVFE